MQERPGDLPRPGLVGRLVRVAFAVPFAYLIFSIGGDLVIGTFTPPPLTDVGYLVAIALFGWLTPVALGELTLQDLGWTPLFTVASLGMIAAATGLLVEGTLLSTILGAYLDVWMLSVSTLMAPALLLAAILGTPGCEMRAYAHLIQRLRGGDAEQITCRGWIDRFDHVRVAGRW